MSCCGNKRKALTTEARTSGRQFIPAGNTNYMAENRPDRVFEYTGNTSFTVRGPISGKQYYFRTKGDKVTVDFMDSFAIMAERDLKTVSGG